MLEGPRPRAEARTSASDGRVVINDAPTVFVLERAYEGRYRVQHVRDDPEPQLLAFRDLCHHLRTLADVPPSIPDDSEGR